jgi:hypothetical protein
MPLKNNGKSKGNKRKRYNTHVVDAATEARLNPMPVISTATSNQGSSGSSQTSVAAPAMGSSPPTFMCPPVHPGYYGTIPPFGTTFTPSYHFPPYSVPPQNLTFPQQQQIPPQPNPPQPQQQQNPPQPQQENVVEEDGANQMNGSGELVPVDDVFPDYPKDSLGRYILKPSGNS